jgi:hypothetical protein
VIDDIKNKISENSGMVNMVINLAILFFLFSVASGIKDLQQEIQQVKSQTQAQIQPVVDEEIFKKRMIEFLIQQLDQQK